MPPMRESPEQSALKPATAQPHLGVAAFGIWTQHVWIYWANTSNRALPESVPWSTLYLIVSVAMLAMGFALARRTDASRDARLARVGWMSAGAGALGSIAIALASLWGSEAAALGGMLVGGIGFAGLYLWWGVFYSQIDLRSAILYLFGGGIVSALVKMLIGLAPPLVNAAIGCATPILSGLSCSSAFKHAKPPTSLDAPIFTRENIAALWKVALIFIVFSVANASMLALQPPTQATSAPAVLFGVHGLELALCLMVIVYAVYFKKAFDFAQLWRIVMFLLATDFLLNILFPDFFMQPFFASVSLNFIVLFVWLTLTDISHHSSLSPLIIFGAGWCCYTLPFYAGSLLAALAPAAGGTLRYAAILLYVIAMASAFCLETRDRSIALIFHDLSDSPHPVPDDFASIDARCERIAAHHHLTARELEVMQMLCRGRSKAYIAETLFITENTVKGHARRLYAKLGVHSKKELQQLIDAY